MKDELFVASQRVLPQHMVSRWAGRLADSKVPWIKNRLITLFCDTFEPDMTQAEIEDPLAYASFNEFFTRALKPGARPFDTDTQAVACPTDGIMSQYGHIAAGRILQAKGRAYSLRELLADDDQAVKQFSEGEFATVYLSPRDYHRVHMPLGGRLTKMTHVPGRLFSVNAATTDAVPRLFARNERVICYFDTDIGPMAVILVGAMIVASIETVWAGLVTPVPKRVRHVHYGHASGVELAKGQEMGRFYLGSTVIVLLPRTAGASWDGQLAPGCFVRVGQTVARLHSV